MWKYKCVWFSQFDVSYQRSETMNVICVHWTTIMFQTEMLLQLLVLLPFALCIPHAAVQAPTEPQGPACVVLKYDLLQNNYPVPPMVHFWLLMLNHALTATCLATTIMRCKRKQSSEIFCFLSRPFADTFPIPHPKQAMEKSQSWPNATQMVGSHLQG